MRALFAQNSYFTLTSRTKNPLVENLGIPFSSSLYAEFSFVRIGVDSNCLEAIFFLRLRMKRGTINASNIRAMPKITRIK